MSKNFHEINKFPKIKVDVNFLEQKYPFSDKKRGHWIESGNLIEFLGEETITWLESKNLIVSKIEIFYTAPMFTTAWHVDMNPPQDLAKLNFVYCEGINYMQWGIVDENIEDLSYQTNSVGTMFLNCDNKISTITDQCHIKKSALVNVGKPHRIVNQSNHNRWCVSLLLWKANPRERLTFHESLNIFH